MVFILPFVAASNGFLGIDEVDEFLNKFHAHDATMTEFGGLQGKAGHALVRDWKGLSIKRKNKMAEHVLSHGAYPWFAQRPGQARASTVYSDLW